jgi:hypothetical protein
MKPVDTRANYRWIISAVCVALFILHIGLQLYWHELKKLDATALGIALIGLSPWIARILASARFGGWEINFLKERIDEQGSDLATLKFLVAHFLSASELKWMKLFANKGKFVIHTTRYADEFKSEIRHLRGLGFIDNHPMTGLRKMYDEGSPGERNVHEYFGITDSGTKYLELRKLMVGDV